MIRIRFFGPGELIQNGFRAAQYEPNASDFTIRSLLMIGPADIFALCASVRLPEQTLGLSGGLTRVPTLLGILLESSAHCQDRKNIPLCVLLLAKTKAPWPSCLLQISVI